MENPEEVLQALDEFQKMRPSEIPRELEDYLCWVAKTGDPVYQWSLIKALFREKLMRVMTDFYENCPTLDITSCPNVEQFNYDIMKSNLLERLESFANAPFTVQRICELLTTPRKEYNRIDKFMRAIEKNILVVSTREPGPYGRHSENGESLVNGSVEDEISHHEQTSNEVEMENWVKDCTEITAVPVNTEDNREMSVENGLNLPLQTAFVKHERIDQLSSVDATTSNFITSTVDFSKTTIIATQVPIQEAYINIQNLTTVNHDAPGIVGDVSDAIMNEDTSSQPSLDSESENSENNETRKLQTTFQTKDFILNEDKSSKIYLKVIKDVKTNESDNESNKECDQFIQSTCLTEELVNENADSLKNSDEKDNVDTRSILSKTDEVNKTFEIEEKGKETSEKFNIRMNNFSPTNNETNEKKDKIENDFEKSSEILIKKKCDIDVKNENSIESVNTDNIPGVTEICKNSFEETSEEVETKILYKEKKISIGKSPLIFTDSNNLVKDESDKLILEKNFEDNLKANKILSDSFFIIEESAKLVANELDNSTLVSELKSELENEEKSSTTNTLVKLPVVSNKVQEGEMIVSSCVEIQSNKGVTELMDIDNEGLIISTEQDEPMEQETIEATNS